MEHLDRNEIERLCEKVKPLVCHDIGFSFSRARRKTAPYEVHAFNFIELILEVESNNSAPIKKYRNKKRGQKRRPFYVR